MLYGAIAGLVDSLKDPHSIFFTPDINKSFLQELNGSFFGIGAEIAIKNNSLQIVAPLSGSPAEKAGLRAADYILKINDEDATKLTLDQAVNKIRGPKGTVVNLTIFRQGDKESRVISITRDEVKIESVSYEKVDNNIGLIKLRYFNQDTASVFDKISNQIALSKPGYLILDMRNNPGGYLDSAVDIASHFINPNQVIVSEKASDGSILEHKTSGKANLSDIKVLVLLNEGSASASEILAGALKDYGIAKIVGMKSYGKGSVQTLFDLKDGSSIKLTIAKWLMPKGGTIEGVGIMPDVEVDLTEEDFNAAKDPQLDKAKEIINTELNVK
jgi:carboxyl-terminal processing protease